MAHDRGQRDKTVFRSVHTAEAVLDATQTHPRHNHHCQWHDNHRRQNRPRRRKPRRCRLAGARNAYASKTTAGGRCPCDAARNPDSTRSTDRADRCCTDTQAARLRIVRSDTGRGLSADAMRQVASGTRPVRDRTHSDRAVRATSSTQRASAASARARIGVEGGQKGGGLASDADAPAPACRPTGAVR